MRRHDDERRLPFVRNALQERRRREGRDLCFHRHAARLALGAQGGQSFFAFVAGALLCCAERLAWLGGRGHAFREYRRGAGTRASASA